jgi:hypothetical protein
MTGITSTNFNSGTTDLQSAWERHLTISNSVFNATPGIFSFSSSNATSGPDLLVPGRPGAPAPIPEPGSMMLLGSGLIGLAAAARRRLANARR